MIWATGIHAMPLCHKHTSSEWFQAVSRKSFGMVYGFALATLQTTSEIGRESVTSIQALDGALYDVPGMEEKQNSNRKQGVPPFRTRLDTDT